MELNQFSDYALRTLIYAGLREPGQCSVREIAESYQISCNHLGKVVHHLARLGYLDTTRGRGGGLRLAADPADIIIGEVLRRSENQGLVECFPPRQGGCCIAPACELKRALAAALAAFFEVLDRYTLADLLEPRSRLAALLGTT